MDLKRLIPIFGILLVLLGVFIILKDKIVPTIKWVVAWHFPLNLVSFLFLVVVLLLLWGAKRGSRFGFIRFLYLKTKRRTKRDMRLVVEKIKEASFLKIALVVFSLLVAFNVSLSVLDWVGETTQTEQVEQAKNLEADSQKSADKPKEEPATKSHNTIKVVAISVLFIAVVVILFFAFYSNWKTPIQILSEPSIRVLIGIVVIYAILAYVSPKVWISYWESGFFFFATYGIILLSGLKKTLKLGFFPLALIGAGLVLLVVWSNGDGISLPSSTKKIELVQPSFQPNVPAEIALPIIALCESGGKQFKEGTKIPLPNKEGSSAFGKYQFLESHRAKALALGFDLNTEEGQDGYARVLYNEPDGIKHWLADSRAKACIEKGLKGSFDPKYGKTVWVLNFRAPTDNAIEFPLGPGIRVGTRAKEVRKKYRYFVYTDEGVLHKKDFPVKEGGEVFKINSFANKIGFQSLENEPVDIVATFSKY